MITEKEREIRIQLGWRLRKCRKSKGLTQQQVANLLGIERPTYTYIETGNSISGYALILELAELYETTLDALFEIGKKGKSANLHGKRDFLSEDETQMLLYYRSLSKKGKELTLKTERSLYKREKRYSMKGLYLSDKE